MSDDSSSSNRDSSDKPGLRAREELIAVPIESFRTATRDINFDVFLRVSGEKVAHVFSRSTGLDYKRLANYISKGVTHLLIHSNDLETYNSLVARSAPEILKDPYTTREKRIATLLNMTEQNMAEIFSQFSIREETVSDTRKLIGNYVELMGENPQSLALILRLVSHGEYLYYHSIATSIFSLFISKAAGIFDRRTLETIGFGAFLHDVGCTQLPDELVNYPGEYGPGQWELMKRHPKLGLDMLGANPVVPDEVRHIVYQHHEEPGGKGYPNAITGASIYYPARIVALADAFSALISRRPYRGAFTPTHSLELLRENPSRFDQRLVELLSAIISKQSEEPRKKRAA